MKEKWTILVKNNAKALGFDYCGIAKAGQLDEDAKKLETWLKNNMHGEMHYMANHFDLRINPIRLVSGTKSVITLLHNYYPAQKPDEKAAKIAKYAYGKDYHKVIRKKLKLLLAALKKEIGEINGRGFVDSAPVLERAWAIKSGLGWVGKNGNLIHKKQGSFFFIATLLVDVELDYDDPFAKDYCGTCTRCIDACPTQAILPNKVVNGSACISYFTIELKSQLLPEERKGQFDNWLFGCDTCQDVCPWNRFSIPNKEEQFTPLLPILNYSLNDWKMLTEDAFEDIFKDSPIKRTQYEGIRRNIKFIE